VTFLSRKRISWLPALVGAFALAALGLGCSGQTGEEASTEEPGEETTAEVTPGAPAGDEVWPPEHVVVQHVLIGFEGSVPGKPVTRSQAEAETLANEILEKAKAGEDFGALVKEHTDDQYPGYYFLANTGIEPLGASEFRRDQMVKGFGDVAFELRIGDVGMAGFNEQDSPFGWHIIKRVEAQ
jgi:hypothetical protein